MTRVRGQVDERFGKVGDAFARNFAEHGDFGAACCVYVAGRRVVDLAGGDRVGGPPGPYDRDTLQVIGSATKGAQAICALRAVERGELDLDVPVARYWPEFAAAGKERITVRALLSHQAGLPHVDDTLSMPELLAWQPIVTALQRQRPLWQPGAGHGYHAFTFGWLVGELLRRVTGLRPGALLRRDVSDPLGIEAWIGLPAGQQHRVSTLLTAESVPDGRPDLIAGLLGDPNSMVHRTFFAGSGLMDALTHSDRGINDPAVWSGELPAANGISNARSLARMYAACLGPVDGAAPLLRPGTVADAATAHSSGPDLVLGTETRYGLGFQLAYRSRPMAGDGSFGHYGIGGTTAFAHPGHELAFAYVTNTGRLGGAAAPRAGALVDAVLAAL